MASDVWPRGSVWRRWDLHVHTPESDDFFGDYQQLIIQLGNADCDVIGINDYFSVAGYREVIRRLSDPGQKAEGNAAYRESLEKLRDKTLLPVVECRMTNVLVDKKGSGPRINFHIIFDPCVDLENIETFLKNQKIKDAIIGSRYSDRKFLKEHVAVDFNAITDALRHDPTFKDHCLIWLPYDEYGGIDRINPRTDKLFKEGLIAKADILGSSNRKQADFFLWKDPTYSEDEYRGWFERKKACIKGSDSHNSNDELGKLKDANSKPTDRYCWIKADPTFEGLKQITIEPQDRVFIGLVPPKLEEVRSNPTRFIERVKIGKGNCAEADDVWFDCDIPINPDMVAIIGNKGSGKSALADVLALAANSHCDPMHYSFLNKQRFCERNGKLARQFKGRIVWSDGSENVVSLSDRADTNGVELVRYIPQSYLERVCTETEPGQQSEFQLELRKVIFSHISDADRLGKETLDELIEYKTEELSREIAAAQAEVARVNAELVRLEERGSKENVARITANVKLKQQELKAHVDAKPAPVEPPADAGPEQKAIHEKISGKLEIERGGLADCDARISDCQEQQKILAENFALAQKIQAKIGNFKADYERLERDTADDLQRLGITIQSILSIKSDDSVLTASLAGIANKKNAIDLELDEANEAGFVARRQSHLKKIAELQDALDAPNKKYQQYTEALRAWDQRAKAIVGDESKGESLEGYQALLKYIENELPKAAEHEKERRREIARSIYASVAAVRDVYKELFGTVQELISSSVLIKESFRLSFESSIADRKFQTELFDRYISQGVTGSFCGKDKGATVLDDLRADVDFNDADDVIAFIEQVVEYLQYDMRTAQKLPTGVATQLRKNIDLREFYNFLWSFGYLEPEYSLKLDGKDLSHLSPGERGTLLLIFYLLVDKSIRPIIVDQPEENLDSHTVYRLLIPVIKDVKNRRQIIMVTHSPNIAVVCDAEQVIHANIERESGNRVVYTSGAIESPVINRYLVDVLEGTRPAFDNRDLKYYAS